MHGGVCVAGAVCGGGHAWQGGVHGKEGMHGAGGGVMAGEMDTAGDGTHPTGLHSYFHAVLAIILQNNRLAHPFQEFALPFRKTPCRNFSNFFLKTTRLVISVHILVLVSMRKYILNYK